MPFDSDRAQQLSDSLGRVPFGFPTLDNRFSGIPLGTAILLAGTPDAGTDAFAYSHAARLMAAKHAPHFSETTLDSSVRDRIPESVHYVTLNHRPRRVLHGMDAILSDRQFDVLTEQMAFSDLSDDFFDLAPVPDALRRAADEDVAADLSAEPATEHSFEQFLTDIAELLESIGDDTLVVLDSLTVFERGRHFGVDWGAVLGLLEGIGYAASEWHGLVDVLYHARPGKVRSDESINTALDGSLYFYANDEGTRAEKTMRVGDFNSALSQRKQVVYETEIREDGFRVSSSRNV